MPVITFNSPAMHKDVRIYAPAGDTHTVLAVAQKNGVKIPYDCKDGDCGSCLILVEFTENANNKAKMAITLSEKEKAKLRELGKITAKEIQDAEVDDLAPHYRLACQFIVREEEVIIHFTGEPGGA
jgi:ferredoxin